jgi:hypothetical protein
MKLRWIIAGGLTAMGVAVAIVLLRQGDDVQKALEETRRALCQQGFKTDIAQFDFSTSDEFRARANALTSLGTWVREPILMSSAGSNVAIVLWKQDKLPGKPYQQSLASLEETLSNHQKTLDAACAAALAGPIRFDLNARAGNFMQLPHLANLRILAKTLDARVILDIHDKNMDTAWTNLLASTRLVTAWDPEPVDFSHLTRFDCAESAYAATWQALQADAWADERLAALQREWESVDFFRGLPEIASFTRASMAATCQFDRQQYGAPWPNPPPAQFLRSPWNAWSDLISRWRRYRYLGKGSYEDEKDFLLYYRDRELALQHAVQCPTWLQMRQLPGVTNTVPFASKYASLFFYSPALMMMNEKQMALSMDEEGKGLLGRAAESEARRRLVVTAIALERFRHRQGAYPKSLEKLAPDFLKAIPVDFMDGQPLRYRTTGDGHFVLYSVGLDCVDDGGLMPSHEERSPVYPGFPGFVVPQKADIVWPRPASDAEAGAQQATERKAREKKQALAEAREAKRAKEEETARQARVKELLSAKPARDAKEPTFNGKPLTKILGNDKASSHLTLHEMLTLKRIITTNDPDIATFELPISYDVVTNQRKFPLSLRLLVDAPANETCFLGQMQGCERATNGNCLLIWNTTYDPPGQHALQAQLFCGWQTLEVQGPVTPFFSSNICQFELFYDTFDSSGATLYARLPESNGIYTIELTSPSGSHLKTFTGTTSNGVITIDWNLIDDQGRRFTNDSFNSAFNVTLPDSGRSQTQKGP